MLNYLSDNNLLLLALVWSLPWKGVALWKAANKKDKWWFIAIFVVNTLAVLEITYIFYFSERDRKKSFWEMLKFW